METHSSKNRPEHPQPPPTPNKIPVRKKLIKNPAEGDAERRNERSGRWRTRRAERSRRRRRAAPGATCCSERHSPSHMPSSTTRSQEDRCAQERRPRRTEEEQRGRSVSARGGRRASREWPGWEEAALHAETPTVTLSTHLHGEQRKQDISYSRITPRPEMIKLSSDPDSD